MFEVHVRTVRLYSRSVMYQTTKVSADRPFSGCTKVSCFDELINATIYVFKKFHCENFLSTSAWTKILLTENLENKI